MIVVVVTDDINLAVVFAQLNNFTMHVLILFQVITGVDCSVDGGISSQLETRQLDDLTQYSCVCPAQSNADSIIHTCTIHVWSCS